MAIRVGTTQFVGYATHPAILDHNVAWTLSFWIKPENVASTYGSLFGMSNPDGTNAIQLFSWHVDTLRFAIRVTDGIASSYALTPNNFLTHDVWQHVTIRYGWSTGAIEFFRNGVFVDFGFVANTGAGTSTELWYLGDYGGTNSYTAAYADIVFHDYALTEPEITSLAQGHSPWQLVGKPILHLPLIRELHEITGALGAATNTGTTVVEHPRIFKPNRRIKAASPIVAGYTVASDDFSEANGTLIAGKALDIGGTWAAHNGSTATVQSGKREEQSASGGGYGSLTDLGVADAHISVDFTVPAGGALDNVDYGIFFRVQDASNGWCLLMEDDTTPGLTLYEMVGGTFFARASGAPSGRTLGLTVNLRVALEGNVITGYLNGVQMLTWTSSSFNTATKAGLRNYVDASVWHMVSIDNFVATAAGVTAPVDTGVASAAGVATVTGIAEVPTTVVSGVAESAGTSTVQGVRGLALLTSLESYWKLNETSGTSFADSHNGNILSGLPQNYGTGKIDGALEFLEANDRYISRASNASLQTGDIDFTFACWVKLKTPRSAATQVILSKHNTIHEYSLELLSGTSLRFYVAVDAWVIWPVALDVDVWYFIVAAHDAVADLVTLQVNNATMVSSATGGPVSAVSTSQFRIGARQLSGFEDHLNGFVDEVGFWKRTLNAGERTILYNGGVGFTYPFTPLNEGWGTSAGTSLVLGASPVTAGVIPIPHRFGGVPSRRYPLRGQTW